MNRIAFSRLGPLTAVGTSEIMAALDDRVHINPLETT